ncbi:MAG: IS30 family transposase, partial [Betaproteobacteria bacterium]|nr:IS30 family transposase [Betaproteobacteria bacterium]
MDVRGWRAAIVRRRRNGAPTRRREMRDAHRAWRRTGRRGAMPGACCGGHPDEPTLRAGHETLYTAPYAVPRGELRAGPITCLRQARKSRCPRARGEDRRGVIPNMAGIPPRPPEIGGRAIPGHREGGPVKGARNASAVGAPAGRTTLFVTPAKMADAAVTGFSTVLNRIGAQRRLSLTYDRGREMAQHGRLSETAGVAACFADPH